jgi:phosphoserine phosphatase RsbU/P
VSGGFPRPLMANSEGVFRLVGDGGLPVGLLEEASFERISLAIKPGERLILLPTGSQIMNTLMVTYLVTRDSKIP